MMAEEGAFKGDLSGQPGVAVLFEEAAADACAFFKDMVMAIRAFGPEVIIGHVKGIAEIVGAAPAIVFARGGAAVFDPIAVPFSAAYRVKLFKIELFVFA